MPANVTAHVANTVGLLPDALYTRDGFVRVSGISKTRLREAKLQGIEPEWLRVGKRMFVHGRDAIAFIEKLAELSASAD